MKAIFGGAAAVATGVSPKDILANTPTPMPLPEMAVGYGYAGPPEMSMSEKKSWAMRRLMDRRFEQIAYPQVNMPPHIAAKKSWSQVYRHSQWQKEVDEARAARDALERDPDFAARVWEMLGGGDL